jgi:hypothetical protein
MGRGYRVAGTASNSSKRQLVTIPGRRVIILVEVESSCHCIRGQSRVAIAIHEAILMVAESGSGREVIIQNFVRSAV